MHSTLPPLDPLVAAPFCLAPDFHTPFAAGASPLPAHCFDSQACSWSDCARAEEDGWPYSDAD